MKTLKHFPTSKTSLHRLPGLHLLLDVSCDSSPNHWNFCWFSRPCNILLKWSHPWATRDSGCHSVDVWNQLFKNWCILVEGLAGCLDTLHVGSFQAPVLPGSARVPSGKWMCPELSQPEGDWNTSAVSHEQRWDLTLMWREILKCHELQVQWRHYRYRLVSIPTLKGNY